MQHPPDPISYPFLSLKTGNAILLPVSKGEGNCLRSSDLSPCLSMFYDKYTIKKKTSYIKRLRYPSQIMASALLI